MLKKKSKIDCAPDETVVKTHSTVNEKPEDKYNIGDLDYVNASSTTDLTGLIMRPPYNDDETASYHDIYSFGPPDTNIRNSPDKKKI